ncbi:uncharacterized protein LOC117783735 [Drosophila innubila]|uniref:uncharacterized protein LOC117783735 n=1 Tax=Drosophila innubila TaxID=198719 RepID=UPI00148D6100|nr:uncharacterized protein LOC117783735 [Drosophila innubila]
MEFSQPIQRLIVQWDTFDCVVNPTIVEFHRCIIVNPEKSLITTEVKYNRAFEQLNASFVLKLPRPSSKEYHKIIDLNVNFCEFYRHSKHNKFLNIAYRSMIMESNLPKKCPQPKGFYYFRNMNIGANLPPFLPKTDFKVQFNFFLPNFSIFNASLSGRLLESARHSKSK